MFKMAGYWLSSFFACLRIDILARSELRAVSRKKNHLEAETGSPMFSIVICAVKNDFP